jgi:hypothetical protein
MIVNGQFRSRKLKISDIFYRFFHIVFNFFENEYFSLPIFSKNQFTTLLITIKNHSLFRQVWQSIWNAGRMHQKHLRERSSFFIVYV